MANESNFEQHYKTSVFRSFINYLDINYPNIDLQEILKTCGVSRQYLSNEHNWLSIDFERKFINLCLEFTGDKDLSYKVGLTTFQKENIGSLSYYLVKNILTLKQILQKLPSLSLQINATLNPTILNQKNNFCEINYKINKELLTNEDYKKLLLSLPSIIRSIEGHYIALLRLKKVKKQRVLVEKIYEDNKLVGATFQLHYEVNKFSFLKDSLSYLPLSLATLAITYFCLTLLSANNKIIYAIACSLLTTIFYASFKKYKQAIDIANKTKKTMEVLDEKYAHEIKLKKNLEENLSQQLIVSKISKNLLELNKPDSMYELITEYLVNEMNFSKAMILTADKDLTTLSYKYASGSLPIKMAEGLKQFKLNLSKKGVSNDAISSVFRSKKSVVIDDIKKFKAQLTEKDSINLIDLSKTEMFIAIPIYTQNRSLGILIADSTEQKKNFDHQKLSTIDTLCNILASYIEKELVFEEKLDALKEVAIQKDDFISIAGHELKSPLTPLNYSVEKLKELDLVKQNKVFKRYLSIIDKSAQQLNEISSDLLDLKNVNEDNLDVETENIDLKSIIDDIVYQNKMIAEEKNIQLIFSANTSNYPVLFDSRHLTRVVSNLISNAIKYTNEGSIEVRCQIFEKSIELSIQDTGLGIPEDKIESIFEKFTQIEGSEKRSQGGVGLGLSIVKKLLEANKSTISVSSELGKGSTFKVCLPKGDTAKIVASEAIPLDKNPSQLIKIDASSEVKAPSNGIEIYAVDDEPFNLEILSEILEGQGYKVKTFNRGQQLIEALESHTKPDLIISDIMMPGFSGFDLIEKIRTKYNRSQLPVVFLSAKTDPNSVSKCFQVGANEHIPKPLNKQIIIERIKKQIEAQEILKATYKFVPWELVNMMGYKSVTDIKIGDITEHDVSIFFSDISSYSRKSENIDNRETIKMLNQYFDVLGNEIYDAKGFIDKYIGDAIFAVFKNNNDALQGSISFQRKLDHFNYHQLNNNNPHLGTRIGLSSGQVGLGPIGLSSSKSGSERMQLTFISDQVNVGAKIEQFGKKIGSSLTVTEKVIENFNFSKGDFTRPLGLIDIGNRLKKESLFEVVTKPEKPTGNYTLAAQRHYEKRLNLYEHKLKTIDLTRSIVSCQAQGEVEESLQLIEKNNLLHSSDLFYQYLFNSLKQTINKKAS